MEKKLEVRNLRISFRTNNGTVKAVRDINFDLEKGETLAIVGESGSGKSVTAKAILGILAPNAIVEGGEIIYDGDDLLKYTEQDFNRIRGNKVTMIFQDPLSSLDPIARIGKQMTEATILNGKTNRKNAKKDFTLKMKQLKEAMEKATGNASETGEMMTLLEKVVRESAKEEDAYTSAMEYVESAIIGIEAILIDLHKGDVKVIRESMKHLTQKLDKIFNDFILTKDNKEFTELRSRLEKASSEYAGQVSPAFNSVLEEMKVYLTKLKDTEQPDFLAMGYYLQKQDKSKLLSMPRAEMNKMLRDTMQNEFLSRLLPMIEKALQYANDNVLDNKKTAIAALKEKRPIFEKENLDKRECKAAIKELRAVVNQSIDRLALRKDSDAYTFGTTMVTNCDRYFKGVVKNPKELARVEREEKKRQKRIAKNADAGKVVPAVLVDLELTKYNMLHTIDRLIGVYEGKLSGKESENYKELAEGMIIYLKDTAYAMLHKVTKQMAYDKAIRIMEDVGIAEPHKRFRQYPFEFSGGMRQRIVIAIAIAANPDILICDEPTTALDVTIQSQILELINELKEKRQLTVIFITHDLGVVANMADKVAVMYAGKIVESGTVDEVFYDPRHPYTWALLSSMPDLDTKEKLESIPGTPPNMIYPPKGDAFAARNKYAMQIDFEEQPPMFKVSDTHYAATWLLHPNAPEVAPPKIVTDRIERMKKQEVQDNER